MRKLILYPGEDGYWVAECPSLPGCISQGDTKETAVKNIREAWRNQNAKSIIGDRPWRMLAA